MANTYKTLSALFSAIADAIRAKTGMTGQIVADNFPAAIGQIQTGSGVDPSDATASDEDIVVGKTAYGPEGKMTGSLKIAKGEITLSHAVTASSYETITHNLGTVPSLILVWVDNTPAFDSTTTYNCVSGYAANFSSGLIPGVLVNKSAAGCINSSGSGSGDTTNVSGTTCVADQITATSFRLRANGPSRCWANGAKIRWVVLAL